MQQQNEITVMQAVQSIVIGLFVLAGKAVEAVSTHTTGPPGLEEKKSNRIDGFVRGSTKSVGPF